MGTIKNHAYTDEQNELAKVIKAIAHPARLAILEHLMKINACVCGDLVNELDLAQATVSQHLKELKNAGLIKGEIEGRNVNYCIDGNAWNKLRENLNNFLVPIQPINDCSSSDCGC
ncbi:MAG: winged helix-turn-helix transcriptional regulator [Cytophagales bacterium]|nr:winged helix-turn-helix transcriptional regulator [Cytophagales bacterium]